ncbi:MAG: ADP-ribosylglycohydrolase family protein [Chloroflexia bacterium]
MKAMDAIERALGCLFGLALGDALGAPTEFLEVGEIRRRFGPMGPEEPSGRPARVTDDTQMALAVAEALVEAPRPLSPEGLEGPLRRAFVEWFASPENNRAPGRTCMAACGRLARGLGWIEATDPNSKGCGANMRVAPVGLLALQGVAAEVRGGVAQFQSALTHGHPTALAASELTAAVVADLALGGSPEGLVGRLVEYARSQRGVYREDWVGDLDKLWAGTSFGSTTGERMEKGWDECIEVLDNVRWGLENRELYLLREDLPGIDPCEATGEGWTAETALGTGLLCFLLYPEEPVMAIRRAAVTGGDSDSIAALSGAFAGAYHGVGAWPADWVGRIEYGDRLGALGRQLGEGL